VDDKRTLAERHQCRQELMDIAEHMNMLSNFGQV
jgi:hypothetical protein